MVEQKRAAALELVERIHGDLAGLEDIDKLREALGDWSEALGGMNVPAEALAASEILRALEALKHAFLGLEPYTP